MLLQIFMRTNNREHKFLSMYHNEISRGDVILITELGVLCAALIGMLHI